MPRTSMLHVRVDDALKADASETLAKFGLTVSDAVRILLTRVVHEGGLPPGSPPTRCPRCVFRAKVQEALADPAQPFPTARSWMTHRP